MPIYIVLILIGIVVALVINFLPKKKDPSLEEDTTPEHPEPEPTPTGCTSYSLEGGTLGTTFSYTPCGGKPTTTFIDPNKEILFCIDNSAPVTVISGNGSSFDYESCLPAPIPESTPNEVPYPKVDPPLPTGEAKPKKKPQPKKKPTTKVNA
jgi:hypothetical protein